MRDEINNQRVVDFEIVQEPLERIAKRLGLSTSSASGQELYNMVNEGSQLVNMINEGSFDNNYQDAEALLKRWSLLYYGREDNFRMQPAEGDGVMDQKQKSISELNDLASSLSQSLDQENIELQQEVSFYEEQNKKWLKLDNDPSYKKRAQNYRNQQRAKEDAAIRDAIVLVSQTIAEIKMGATLNGIDENVVGKLDTLQLVIGEALMGPQPIDLNRQVVFPGQKMTLREFFIDAKTGGRVFDGIDLMTRLDDAMFAFKSKFQTEYKPNANANKVLAQFTSLDSNLEKILKNNPRGAVADLDQLINGQTSVEELRKKETVLCNNSQTIKIS